MKAFDKSEIYIKTFKPRMEALVTEMRAEGINVFALIQFAQSASVEDGEVKFSEDIHNIVSIVSLSRNSQLSVYDEFNTHIRFRERDKDCVKAFLLGAMAMGLDVEIKEDGPALKSLKTR